MTVIASVISAFIEAFSQIWRKLREILHRLRERSRLPKRARRATAATCVPIREAAFHRPDPLIYSQYDLMRRGFAVTWDNPDIDVRRNGGSVSTSGLEPSTDYEIVARIWNNSTDAPVIGLPVKFSFLSFGIGIQSQPISATAINLGVKGGPDHPAFARTMWRTPAEPGHYCLQVLLDPVDDTNFGNNLGQDNVVVGHPHSPADFTFQIRNDRTQQQTIRLEVDSYRIPKLVRCEERPPPRPQTPAAPVMVDGLPTLLVPAGHDRANHPVPAGWLVELTPAELHLAPGQQATIAARVTPPDNFIGAQSLNVNAFDAVGFVGGVTLRIEVP